MDTTTHVSAKTSLLWVIATYVAALLIAIAGSETWWLAPALLLVVISPITMPITVWRRRGDYASSAAHRIAFFGSLAFLPLALLLFMFTHATHR